MASGSIHHDEYRVRKGFFQAKKAINLWPEWGLFGLAYIFGNQHYQSDKYQDAMEYIWKNTEVCFDIENRSDFRYEDYIKHPVYTGPKRACWNSWIAPHNLEGFMLIHGDMVTKNGDIDLAMSIYKSIKKTKDYSSWAPKFKRIVEDRINNIQKNVSNFRVQVEGSEETDELKTLIFDSKYSCRVCHQGDTAQYKAPKVPYNL